MKDEGCDVKGEKVSIEKQMRLSPVMCKTLEHCAHKKGKEMPSVTEQRLVLIQGSQVMMPAQVVRSQICRLHKLMRNGMIKQAGSHLTPQFNTVKYIMSDVHCDEGMELLKLHHAEICSRDCNSGGRADHLLIKRSVA